MPKVTMMRQVTLGLVFLLSVVLANPASMASTAQGSGEAPAPPKQEASRALLPGDRMIVGVVKDVQGEMIKVDTGELEPRFLPIRTAKEKGVWPINNGDKLTMVVNDLNLVVDFYHAGEPGRHHVVRGELVTPMVVGHDRAIIRTEDGKEKVYVVGPLARSRVAGVPIGVPALFLVDDTNRITDAFWGSKEALARAEIEYAASKWYGSPPKAAQSRLAATIVKPLKDGSITVRTEDGKQQQFETRLLAAETLKTIAAGEDVILLIDDENRVIDVATPKQIKG
jgi:hypothetical protein